MEEFSTDNRRVTGSSPVTKTISGCSSVWLERLIWVQEAAGSSPVTRTTLRGNIIKTHYSKSILQDWEFTYLYMMNLKEQVMNLFIMGETAL